jgi:hypothetical protein
MSNRKFTPLCYVGPSQGRLRHGMVFKDREAVQAARLKYKGSYFDELLVPQAKQHEAVKQIREGKGAAYVFYKRAEKE